MAQLTQPGTGSRQRVLTEDQVKSLLNQYGIPTPRFAVISCQEEIARLPFGYPVALKVCSPEILHKTEAGGVKLGIPDLGALVQVFLEMRGRFPGARFLVETMEPDGLEVIIGLIHDPNFGLCIMLGLGGVWAEVLEDVSFRALPITRQDAEQMLGELRARRVLEGFRGQQVDREALVDLLLKLSDLGMERADEIGQLDLNPVIVRSDGLSVVDAKLVRRESAPAKPVRPIRDPAALRPLLYPRSLAIIGASASPEKFGWMLVRNILEGGYTGKVYPINPRAPEILGLPVHKSILDVPGDVDLALVCVPFEHVLQSVKECGEKGVQGLAITTGGYDELGERGRARGDELAALLGQYPEMRVIGPNMMGLLNADIQLYAAFAIETLVPKFKRGGIGLITQSGSVASAFLQNAGQDSLGFTQFIPTGNKLDTDEADFIRFLDENPSVTVIAAQLEGFHHGPRFMEVIRTAGKPIVVMKTGRTSLGSKVAQSHTASLATNTKVMAGVLKQHRIYQAETSEEFYDLSKALACLGRVTGRAVLVVETSGGVGIIATDQIASAGLELPGLAEEDQFAIRQVVAPHAVVSNPLDIAAISADTFIRVAERIVLDQYDLIWLIFADPVERASEAVQAFRNRTDKPIIVEFSGGGDVEAVEKRRIVEMGVPVFPSAERALPFLRYFADPWFAQR